MLSIAEAIREGRRAAGLSQEALAARAGVTRMTLQRIEANLIDPRVSTVVVLARALGLELLAVPTLLRPEVEAFVRSGGKILAQSPGVSAPPSIVDVLERPRARSRKPSKDKP